MRLHFLFLCLKRLRPAWVAMFALLLMSQGSYAWFTFGKTFSTEKKDLWYESFWQGDLWTKDLWIFGVKESEWMPNNKLDLVGDVNRDGFIDFFDDELAESESDGVLVLPNLDDDSERCDAFKQEEAGFPLETEAFIACNDAADTESNGWADIDDLTMVEVTAPYKVTDDAVFTLSLLNADDGTPDTSGKFRVLVDRGDKFVDVTVSPITLEDLRKGLVLGVEATDVLRKEDGWNGKAKLQAELTMGGESYKDDIPLAVAPIITQHDLGHVKRIFASPPELPAAFETDEDALARSPDEVDLFPYVARHFINDLKQATEDVVSEFVTLADANGDIWAQDYFEPAFVSRPSPYGSQVIRVMLRSANLTRTPDISSLSRLSRFQGRTVDEIYNELYTLSMEEYFAVMDQLGAEDYTYDFRESGIALYTEMRGPGVGVVELDKDGLSDSADPQNDTWNSAGNFTTVPPFFTKEQRHLSGRMVYGSTPNPKFIELLKSQNLQQPIRVPTEWLFVGHVDEFITFLPSYANERGWVVGVADPALAYDILRGALDKSSEELAILSGANALAFPDADGHSQKDHYKVVISDLLADEATRNANDFAISKIDEAMEILRRELDLKDDDIVRIPVLYKEVDYLGGPEDGADDSNAGADDSNIDLFVSAYMPNAVNGVYLGSWTFVAPKQFGPMVGGQDLMQVATEEALAPHGINVRWVDGFQYAHVGDGEIHCVTNTHRDLSDVMFWWEDNYLPW